MFSNRDILIDFTIKYLHIYEVLSNYYPSFFKNNDYFIYHMLY